MSIFPAMYSTEYILKKDLFVTGVWETLHFKPHSWNFTLHVRTLKL